LPFHGKNHKFYDLEEPEANNLVNANPLLGLEFFAKMDILEIVLRASSGTKIN